MTVKVKICGVRTPAILDAAARAGADMIGLVFFAKSPRALSVEAASVLARAASGRLQTVAVMVDPDDALVDAVANTVQPDVFQLHGNETPARAAAIKTRTGARIFKAIAVSGAADVAGAEAYAGVADQILFDAKAMPGALLPGGNGAPFDWSVLSAARHPFALSGGLDVGNVAEAIHVTGAELVDVSSGVETAPGHKDETLVAAFIAAAHGTAAERARAS